MRGFELTSRVKDLKDAVLPKRNDPGSAGYDFYLFEHENLTIKPGEQVEIYSGVKAYMLQDEVLLLNIRSSLGIKHGLMLSNSQGWIDMSYYNNKDNEGEIIFSIKNNSIKPFTFTKGDKIGQALFVKHLSADNDEVVNKERHGGLGSSDFKRSSTERIYLERFGKTTRFDAAHVIDANGHIVAAVAEPISRQDGWGYDLEFAEAVRDKVAEFEDGPYAIQYDPGRDNYSEEWLLFCPLCGERFPIDVGSFDIEGTWSSPAEWSSEEIIEFIGEATDHDCQS